MSNRLPRRRPCDWAGSDGGAGAAVRAGGVVAMPEGAGRAGAGARSPVADPALPDVKAPKEVLAIMTGPILDPP